MKNKFTIADHILLGNNFDISFEGFKLIRYILVQDVDLNQIENVYQLLAEEFGSTRNRVERNIRYTISKSNFEGYSNKKALHILKNKTDSYYEGEYNIETEIFDDKLELLADIIVNKLIERGVFK